MVIDIREYDEFVFRLQALESRDGVGLRLPDLKRIGKRVHFFFRRDKAVPLAELMYHLAENFVVAAIRILKWWFDRAVKREDFVVAHLGVVHLQDGTKSGENSLLPVDESAVAVEGQEVEVFEIERHSSRL